MQKKAKQQLKKQLQQNKQSDMSPSFSLIIGLELFSYETFTITTINMEGKTNGNYSSNGKRTERNDRRWYA